MRLGSQELLLLLLIVLLLFGATRLPRLARSLREARDEFQKGADEDVVEQPKPPTEPPPAPSEAPSAEVQRPPDTSQT